LEAQEGANPAPSSPKDLRSCCQQRLFPLKEDHPYHHNQHHNNNNNHHNYDNNNHTSAKYQQDNEGSDTPRVAHHHLSPSLNLHSSHGQARPSSFCER